MRWFFLAYGYEPGLRPDAGGFRKLWELAHALQQLGHEAHVFYPGLPSFEPLRPVPAHRYPVLPARGLRPASAYASMAMAALRAGRRGRPDVLYFRTGVDVLPVGLGRVLGARVVLEVNADVSEFLGQEGAPGWRRRLFAAAERLNVGRSDLVVALTPGLRRTLIERYRVPEGKVRVIPSGTDPEHFVPGDAGAAKARLGLAPDRPVVGFVGLFYRHQGVQTLVAAAPRLLAAAPGCLLLLVGDGVMRAHCEAEAARLGVAASVRFTGQVAYRDVPGYLRAMDVLAAPFTGDRGETSPFKVLDALASGRPVVASALPSVRPLAEETGAVSLVPPDDPAALADALAALLHDPARRRAGGTAGRAWVVERYGWPRIARELAAALTPAARHGGERIGLAT